MKLTKLDLTENIKRNHLQFSKMINTYEVNKAKAEAESLAKQKQA